MKGWSEWGWSLHEHGALYWTRSSRLELCRAWTLRFVCSCSYWCSMTFVCCWVCDLCGDCLISAVIDDITSVGGEPMREDTYEGSNLWGKNPFRPVMILWKNLCHGDGCEWLCQDAYAPISFLLFEGWIREKRTYLFVEWGVRQASIPSDYLKHTQFLRASSSLLLVQ